MRKLVLGLIFISHVGHAQEINKSLGYFIDMAGIELTNFFDLDYDGLVFHNEIYSLSTEYIKGYYVDVDGTEHQGYLNGPNRYGASYSHFFFKESLSSSSKKIKATKIKYFKTELDSFFVYPVFTVRKKSGTLTLNNRFLGLVTENDEMFVFQYVLSGMPHFFIKLKDGGGLISVPKKEKDFRAVIKPIFKSSQFFSLLAASEDYNENDFISIVKNYEMEMRYKSGEKTWYNKNWIECDEDQATGYMEVINLVDPVFTVEYHSKNSEKLILRGQYSSVFPALKEGKFEWYYSNGNVRKTGCYTKNSPQELFVEYFENGQVHRKYRNLYSILKYEQVYSAKGEELLVDGTGVEMFYDSMRAEPVMITRKYRSKRLVEAFYLDAKGEKIYQKCSSRPFAKPSLKRSLLDFEYSDYEGSIGREGNVLVRLLIDSKGVFKEFEILRGVSLELDASVMRYLGYRRSYSPVYKLARMGKEKVTYETILTFSFAISDKNEARNSYYDWSFMHQMNYQMMINQPLNLPPPPSFR